MPLLFHGNCLEEMKSLDDASVDLIFCDLPYGQTSCKWDCKIDLTLFWEQIMRIKKLHTPIFFTTTTKFGVDLITSAPKKCFFRYDLVWVKSAAAGFLSAKKMPMRKHEMIYVFYEKLPLYDISSHKHKFIKEVPVSVVKENNNHIKDGQIYNGGKAMNVVSDGKGNQYKPPLPVSVVKEDVYKAKERFKNGKLTKHPRHLQKGDDPIYDPPLPVSVVKQEPEPERKVKSKNSNKGGLYNKIPRLEDVKYNPPLPVSVVKEGGEYNHIYGEIKDMDYQHLKGKMGNPVYKPPLPVSVVKQPEPESNHKTIYGDMNIPHHLADDGINRSRYEPPLPTTMLEVKSTRGKHSTEKPVALMKWILKYYSKEGDVVLDPTMGSGSTGIACAEMNREFIGIEMDPEIFEGACDRLE